MLYFSAASWLSMPMIKTQPANLCCISFNFIFRDPFSLSTCHHCWWDPIGGHGHPGQFLFCCHHRLLLPLCLWRKFCPVPRMKREFHQYCRKMHFLKQSPETAALGFQFLLVNTSNQVCSQYSAGSEGSFILVTEKGVQTKLQCHTVQKLVFNFPLEIISLPINNSCLVT